MKDAGIVPLLEQQRSAGGAAEQDFAQKLVDEAKKSGLQKTADAALLECNAQRRPTAIAKNGVISNLADSASLLTQAFSTAKGAPPASAATGEGFAVFQVDDVKPAHAPAFADAKAQILSDYRDQKAPELLNAQLNKLADRAKVLNDLKKAAAEMNVPVKTSDLGGHGRFAGPGYWLDVRPGSGGVCWRKRQIYADSIPVRTVTLKATG